MLHHSILAYSYYARFDRLHYLRSSAPIVDHNRWIGFDLLVDFNDIYFMSLMFLISGLFVMPSLSRRGSWNYLAGRAVRLGLPFLVAVTVIMPVAYYPSYLQTGASLSFPQYWIGYFTSYGWPAGPAWFIWVLLTLDALAVLVAMLNPAVVQNGTVISDWLLKRPSVGLGLLLAVAALAYLPMLYVFGPTRWFSWGPFAVQASRVALYAIFFATGAVLGAAGLTHPLLGRAGPFAKGWTVCAGLALIAFCGLAALQRSTLLHDSLQWHALGAVLFILVCVLTGVALIGGFIRHLDVNRSWLDLLAPSAFAIYVLHYAPLTWIQTALLASEIPAVAKASATFIGTLFVSCILAALLRQSPKLRQVL